MTDAPRNADELLAQAMGVSVAHFRARYGHTPTGDAYKITDARLRAMAASADVEAARHLDEMDIEDAAQEDDPKAALREMVAADSDRRLRAQIAANTRWARTPEDERRRSMDKAREAFDARFERQVDPDGVLTPQERVRRAGYARKAYFAQLALKSAQARRRKVASR